VDSEGVDRAMTAVKSLAADLGLATDQITVLHNSNKLALRLSPCDVFARVARVGREVAAFEIDIAQQLAQVGAPAVALDPRVDALAYRRDGFVVTWWTYHHATDQLGPRDYARALKQLHVGMRAVQVGTPHFLDRVREAEELVTDREQTPELNATARALLLGTLTDACDHIDRIGAPVQLLHGEPHPGNVLATPNGPRFIDLETCCTGPVEFDVAHAPNDLDEHYPQLDHELLGHCRQLILAMIAAWRWDVNDEFPDGPQYGRLIMDVLRAGPPWPSVGDLRNLLRESG